MLTAIRLAVEGVASTRDERCEATRKMKKKNTSSQPLNSSIHSQVPSTMACNIVANLLVDLRSDTKSDKKVLMLLGISSKRTCCNRVFCVSNSSGKGARSTRAFFAFLSEERGCKDLNPSSSCFTFPAVRQQILLENISFH